MPAELEIPIANASTQLLILVLMLHGLGVPGYQIKVVHETGEVVHTYVYHFLKQV